MKDRYIPETSGQKSTLQVKYPSLRMRLGLIVLLAMVTTVLTTSLVLLWPYLEREHARLPAWQIPLLWFGDVLALLGFVWYTTYYGIFGNRFRGGPIAKVTRFEKWFVIMLFGGAALDFAISISLIVLEELEYAHGVKTEATVEKIETRGFPRSKSYALLCSFVDEDGQRHEARFILSDSRKDHPDPTFVRLRPQLVANNVPFPLLVQYLPDRPQVHRIAGQIWWHGDRLHCALLVLQALQFCGLGLFLAAITKRASQWELPWWWDMHLMVPLLAAMALILITLIGELGIGRFAWVAG